MNDSRTSIHPLKAKRLILAIGVATLLACEPPLVPPGGFTSDPIETIGHGTFIGSGGRPIEPTTEFILAAQAYYIAERESESASVEAPRVRARIDEFVADPILANALYLDWLIAAESPRGLARATMANDALRYHYVFHLQPNPVLPSDGRWSKGVAVESARRLEALGIPVFIATDAAGPAYIEECKASGVPVPDTVFGRGWIYQGEIQGEFIEEEKRADLYAFKSQAPEGICLALPRSRPGEDARPLGIICLGITTSKACFFDSPNGQSFARDVPVPIGAFLGGSDLASNGQGTCTDCHAGENPFVVHPEKPPFASLGASLQPLAWHDPLVDPSWPQNPGPSNLLDGVTSQQSCGTCHRVGLAGRFPEVSKELPGYCSVVLTTATGSSAKRTMPPGGQATGPYANHIEALRKACGAPPGNMGTVVDFDVPDDRSHVSAPAVIGPIYQCATKVAVRGAVLDADLRLFRNEILVESRIARNPNVETFDVPPLVAGDVLTALQIVGGTSSKMSKKETARDHTLDYPMGLPAPEIDPTLIYECAESIAVRHVPGADVTVFSNGGDAVTDSGSTSWTIFRPGKFPFEVGDAFSARQALCKDRSPTSASAKATTAPKSLPAPTFDPPQVYEGQELVTIETLVNGSRTSVSEASAGFIGEFRTPVSWRPDYDVATPLGGPLQLGDQLLAQQSLCSVEGPRGRTPPPERCEALPPPRIRHPRAGDTSVVVTEAVPGARVRVYDAANEEIGDGSGHVVALRRAVTASDTLTVTQQVGSCTSRQGYRVSVRN